MPMTGGADDAIIRSTDDIKRAAMKTMPSNLFADIDAGSAQEAVAILAMAGGVRIERIVSTGQASPTGFWYDQAEAEWVLVVSGSAELLFEGDDHAMRLGPGDYLLIPPHRRHRVEWTDPERPTVWLAVHFPV